MTKLAVFSHQKLMIAVNSFSSMCTIALTIPQFLHVMLGPTITLWTLHLVNFPATIGHSILCLNSKKTNNNNNNNNKTKQKTNNKLPAPIFKFMWMANKQTMFWPYVSAYKGLNLWTT